MFFRILDKELIEETYSYFATNTCWCDIFEFSAGHASSSGNPKTLQVGEKKSHPSHIPDHLPAFPDSHTYIRTLVGQVSLSSMLSLIHIYMSDTWGAHVSTLLDVGYVNKPVKISPSAWNCTRHCYSKTVHFPERQFLCFPWCLTAICHTCFRRTSSQWMSTRSSERRQPHRREMWREPWHALSLRPGKHRVYVKMMCPYIHVSLAMSTPHLLHLHGQVNFSDYGCGPISRLLLCLKDTPQDLTLKEKTTQNEVFMKWKIIKNQK